MKPCPGSGRQGVEVREEEKIVLFGTAYSLTDFLISALIPGHHTYILKSDFNLVIPG